MSERKINLEEILKMNLPSTSFESDNWLDLFEKPVVKNWIIIAMKEACKQVLELAAENATTDYHPIYTENLDDVIVSKQSILDTIKQIE